MLAHKYMDVATWLPCLLLKGQQVSHKRWIWGIHCMQVMKHASEGITTLALKPRADVTRSLRQGYQWPTKRTYVLQIFFKKSCDWPSPTRCHFRCFRFRRNLRGGWRIPHRTRSCRGWGSQDRALLLSPSIHQLLYVKSCKNINAILITIIPL